jgi:hypothetical protein
VSRGISEQCSAIGSVDQWWMYLDRISGLNFEGLHSQQLREIPQLICKVCKHHLGTPMIYEKEDRLAYRLFVGAVSKRIVKEK